jgi:hypothetical protein
MSDGVLKLILSRYDVRELHSNDKSVPNISRCGELTSLISVTSILIQAAYNRITSRLILFRFQPKRRKLIFNLTFKDRRRKLREML